MLADMAWQAAKLALIAFVMIIVVLMAQFLYLCMVLTWREEKTNGTSYYGRPLDERRRFRRLLRLHRTLLCPIIWLLGRVSRFTFAKASFSCRGIAAPKGSCSPDSFLAAIEYQPHCEDVFVVTQMRCGTTWMQHLVYQVLTRGTGDLAADGTALYALSGWLESTKSVGVANAPLIGQGRPSRIIKTHLPVALCPYCRDATYIYVCRHPLACYASCVDFLINSADVFRPTLDDIEEWFCTEELMWWGTWPSHVQGWWELSQKHDNVHFFRYEQMKEDLPAVGRQIARCLGLAELSEEELRGIVGKCGFDYMRQHKDCFEMAPPHLFQSREIFFVRGRAGGNVDIPKGTRERLRHWCQSSLAGSDFPLAKFYPDVAEVR